MKTNSIDRGGIFISLSCLVHCIVCAVFPAVWGLLGTSAEFGETLEWAFTLLACAFAALTLWLGWRKMRSVRIAALFLAGIVLLLGARVVEQVHHASEGDRDVVHASITSQATAEDVASDGHHHEEAHHAHGDDQGEAHELVLIIAILATLFLVSGHIASLRASRCCAPTAAPAM